MKITKFKVYSFIELILYFILLIFQIIYLSFGYNLLDNSRDIFIYIAILHVLITLVSLIYSSYLFFKNKDKEIIREDLFVIYFIFIFVADIFFSFVKIDFIGHILFILAYLLLMFIRQARIYEYIGAFVLGSIILVTLLILKRLSLIMAIDSFLASLIITNMIFSIIKFIKKRDNISLILMIASILIFISDLSIGISELLSVNVYLSNTLCLLIWPTYILACILLNLYYKSFRE